MAVVDLAFAQLQTAMVANGLNPNAISMINNRLMLDISIVSGSNITSVASYGVVKFMTKLLDYCLDAQHAINQEKEVGEKLVSFGIQAYTAPTNGFVPVVHSVTANYGLDSTTQIVGVVE